MKYAIIFIITLCATIYSLNVFKDQLVVAQMKQTSEGYCIGQMVATGIKRSDIKTDNGTCYYEPISYSNP